MRRGIARHLIPGILTLAIGATALVPAPAFAAVEALEFSSAAQEADYKHLTETLRCLVCQNQNIADSNAELALDLRHKTYELVRQGKTNDQIVDFMVKRYGDFVMYNPPLRGDTLLLWIGPFVILLIGIGLMLRTIARRRAASVTPDVDQEILHTAGTLLGDNHKTE